MRYAIFYTGHVNERVRPEGFPKKIGDHVVVHVNSKEELVQKVNDFMAIFVRNQGMVVRKNPGAMEDPAKLDTNRMFVPMALLSHIDSRVAPITGEIPEVDPDGKTVNFSRKPVMKN